MKIPYRINYKDSIAERRREYRPLRNAAQDVIDGKATQMNLGKMIRDLNVAANAMDDFPQDDADQFRKYALKIARMRKR